MKWQNKILFNLLLHNTKVRQQLGIGIEIPLDSNMPQPELTSSLVAFDEKDDSSLEIHSRVDVETLNDWATVTWFMSSPEIIDNSI